MQEEIDAVKASLAYINSHIADASLKTIVLKAERKTKRELNRKDAAGKRFFANSLAKIPE